MFPCFMIYTSSSSEKALNEGCTHNSHCHDTNAECNSEGMCTCKAEFYISDGVCHASKLELYLYIYNIL